MRSTPTLATLAIAGIALTGCSAQNIDWGTAIGAATQGVQALTLSDADVKSMALQAAQYSDQQNQVAPASSAYAKRLTKIIGKHTKEGDTTLNYKVYLVKEVNAFAMADGTVRVFSGLMDMMTDDELRFVIGHEVGHAVLGHSAKSMRTAYAASAARAGVAAAGGTAGRIAASELGGLTEAVINAQFSQSEESEADEYGLEFMRRNGYQLKAAPAALRKLATLGGGDGPGFLSSHPDPEDRAANLEANL